MSGARRWLVVAAVACAADGGKAWAMPCMSGPLARRPAFPVRWVRVWQRGRPGPPAVCQHGRGEGVPRSTAVTPGPASAPSVCASSLVGLSELALPFGQSPRILAALGALFIHQRAPATQDALLPRVASRRHNHRHARRSAGGGAAARAAESRCRTRAAAAAVAAAQPAGRQRLQRW